MFHSKLTTNVASLVAGNVGVIKNSFAAGKANVQHKIAHYLH